jgi:hypothetical protein
MAADWFAKLGRKDFELLVAHLAERSFEKALRDRVEPRLVGIENRLAATGTRLEVADNLASRDSMLQ